MKSPIEGLDDLRRRLTELEKKIDNISGIRYVPINELLTPEFMSRFTRFTSPDEMLEQSGFQVETQEDFDNIQDDAWDEYIAANTQFPSWNDLLAKAGEEYLAKIFES